MTLEEQIKNRIETPGTRVNNVDRGDGTVTKHWRTNNMHRVLVVWDDKSSSQVNARYLEVM